MGKIANLTPVEFEKYVKRTIQNSGIDLSEFEVKRNEKIKGKDGEYQIDVTARFKALNTNFLVLIECKHHKNPIKREVIQILHDRLDSVDAQKGMVFSSVCFQKGAVEYAKKHNIALVLVTDNQPIMFNSIARNPPIFPRSMRKGGWLVHLNENNEIINTLLELYDPHLILEELGISVSLHESRKLGRITIKQDV